MLRHTSPFPFLNHSKYITMHYIQSIWVGILLSLFFLPSCSKSNSNEASEKETFFPQQAWNVAENNDYQNKSSQFNIHRMTETPNLVAFWEAGFGDDPENCSDEKFRFPMQDILKESEKMFCFFRDELKFVEKGSSLTDKYRMILYFFYNEDGTVYGGGSDEKVGVMWISPGRVKTSPYGAIAHEMGHAFQYMVSVDGGWGYSSGPEGSRGQAIFEMSSQYMLWQYYSEWITFENYHLQNFLANTHKAFLHEDNCYCAPFVLEYWADKYGKDFIGKLWRESQAGEDPVMTYKRLTGIDQKTFNDEMLNAGRKFITWDIDRVREVSKAYINMHKTEMTATGDGWYMVSEKNCPQNYGYNGIQLVVPAEGTEISIDFEGKAGTSGYRAIQTDKAGWRYGFMAMKKDGERVYSDIFSDNNAHARFTVPENAAHLWLVVTGAPTEHWEHLWDNDTETDEQWPYRIKLTGTELYK